MKILIWSQYFWPETFPINEIAKALSDEGHTVLVLTGKPNYPKGKFFEGYKGGGICEEYLESIKVIRIPILERGNGAIHLAMNYLSFVLSGYLNAKRALRKEVFDLVFVYAPSPIFQALPAISVATESQVPLIVWVQDLWPEVLETTRLARSREILNTLERIVRYIYKKADLILAQSETFREQIARQVSNPSKVVYFPNSERLPNLNGVGSASARHLASAMRNCFAITYTGNLGSVQSLETIIYAALELREFEDIKFFLVGTGSRLTQLTEQINTYGLSNVILAGHFQKEDMPIIAQASQALLLTLNNSRIGSATIPSKLQSYLAMGKPILASAEGEAAQVVLKAQSGMVCKAGDGVALAEAILYLRALPPHDRAALGSNGRAYFEENFEINTAVRRLVNILESTKVQFDKSNR